MTTILPWTLLDDTTRLLMPLRSSSIGGLQLNTKTHTHIARDRPGTDTVRPGTLRWPGTDLSEPRTARGGPGLYTIRVKGGALLKPAA